MSHHQESICRVHRGVALALVASLAVVGACGGDDGGEDGGGSTTVAADGTTTTTAATGATSGSETSEAPAPGTASSDATGPTPTITSFTTPDDIDCHNGNEQTFTARWETTDAVEVTISIDGPGVYDEYPPSGEASLPFNCASSHTFLLTAIGDGGRTATKSVTLEPRNVQPPDNANQDQ